MGVPQALISSSFCFIATGENSVGRFRKKTSLSFINWQVDVLAAAALAV